MIPRFWDLKLFTCRHQDWVGPVTSISPQFRCFRFTRLFFPAALGLTWPAESSSVPFVNLTDTSHWESYLPKNFICSYHILIHPEPHTCTLYLQHLFHTLFLMHLFIYSFNKYLLNFTLYQGLGTEQWTRPMRPLFLWSEKNHECIKTKIKMRYAEKRSHQTKKFRWDLKCAGSYLDWIDKEDLWGGDIEVETWMTGKGHPYHISDRKKAVCAEASRRAPALLVGKIESRQLYLPLPLSISPWKGQMTKENIFCIHLPLEQYGSIEYLCLPTSLLTATSLHISRGKGDLVSLLLCTLSCIWKLTHLGMLITEFLANKPKALIERDIHKDLIKII